MKQNILIISFLILGKLSISQNDIELTLTRGWRYKSFSNRDNYMCFSKRNEQNDSVYYMYQGEILDITKDSIVMIPWEISQTVYYKDKRSLSTIKTYNDDKISRVAIYINDISEIISESSTRSNIFMGGAVVAATSALVVAPLASINYKDGTFDTRNYAVISGASWLSFFPCLGLALGLDEKIYHIKSGKRDWTIVH